MKIFVKYRTGWKSPQEDISIRFSTEKFLLFMLRHNQILGQAKGASLLAVGTGLFPTDRIVALVFQAAIDKGLINRAWLGGFVDAAHQSACCTGNPAD